MNLVKTPEDIFEFMKNIDYGYIDRDGNKHVNTLKNFRKEYRTLSIDDVINYKIGTCIEHVYLMHTLLDKLNIDNKMFCTRVYESGDIPEDREEHMHCFILYYDNNGIHQIEHSDSSRRGIYHYSNEEEALKTINEIYTKMAGGVNRPLTEFFNVEEGLTFKQFNDYINSLDNYSKKKR